MDLFRCPTCEKGFGRKSNMQKHKEIHGDKLRCDWCNKELNTSAILQQHLKTCNVKCQRKKLVPRPTPSPSAPPQQTTPPPTGPLPNMPDSSLHVDAPEPRATEANGNDVAPKPHLPQAERWQPNDYTDTRIYDLG